MGLKFELEQAKAKTGGVPRKLDVLLGKLPLDEQKALKEALGSREWSARGISRALGTAGHPVSATAIKSYRADVLGVSFD